MTAIDRIIDELRRAHDGDPWHGPSVMAQLEGVSAAHAAARPLADAHTIWELVLHMTTWRNEIARRLRTGVALELEGPDFPPMPEPTEAAWADTRHAFAEAFTNLIQAAAKLPPAHLDNIIDDRRAQPSGPTSYYVMLHGSAQHDAYHGGQIGILKKALKPG